VPDPGWTVWARKRLITKQPQTSAPTGLHVRDFVSSKNCLHVERAAGNPITPHCCSDFHQPDPLTRPRSLEVIPFSSPRSPLAPTRAAIHPLPPFILVLRAASAGRYPLAPMRRRFLALPAVCLLLVAVTLYAGREQLAELPRPDFLKPNGAGKSAPPSQPGTPSEPDAETIPSTTSPCEYRGLVRVVMPF
jgi:hypothetical protein